MCCSLTKSKLNTACLNEIQPLCFCCSALPQLPAHCRIAWSLSLGWTSPIDIPPKLLFSSFYQLCSHKARTSADKSPGFTPAELSAAFNFLLNNVSHLTLVSLLSWPFSLREFSLLLSFVGLECVILHFLCLFFFVAVPFLWLVLPTGCPI